VAALEPRDAQAAGPRYRRLEPDERRAQILTVARRMFTELPYAEVSTTAIAREAGVQRGLIHYYFGAKRDLFLTVVRELVSQMAYEVPQVDLNLPLDTLLDLFVQVFLDAAEANSAIWFAAIDAEGFGQDPELLRIVTRVRDRTVENMLTVLRIEPTDTVRAVLRVYSGLAEAATRQWLQAKTLSRAQVHALLAGTLRTMITDVTPAIEAL
jgi:AcrR family transcriptional regulator